MSSERSRSERSTPQVGIGLRSKISNDLIRFSRIQSGSPLILESSAITSREIPLRATSCPCSFSLIGLGLAMRVLSDAAIAQHSSGPGGFPDAAGRNFEALDAHVTNASRSAR